MVCFGLHFCCRIFRYIFNNFSQCASKATEFGEMTQNNVTTPFKVIQGHRFGTNRKLIYDFLFVINTNLPHLAPFPIYSLRQIQNRYIWLTLLCLTPPPEGFPWDDLRKIIRGRQRMAGVSNGVENLPKFSTGWVGCTSVTDRQTDRQTDGRTGDSI